MSVDSTEISSLLLDESKNLNVEHVHLVCPYGLSYSEQEEIFDLYQKIKSTELFNKCFKNSFTSFVLYFSKRIDSIYHLKDFFLKEAEKEN